MHGFVARGTEGHDWRQRRSCLADTAAGQSGSWVARVVCAHAHGAQGSCLGQQVGVGLPSWGRSTRQLMRRHGGEGIIALGDDKKLGFEIFV